MLISGGEMAVKWCYNVGKVVAEWRWNGNKMEVK